MKNNFITLIISLILFNCASKKEENIYKYNHHTYISKISDDTRKILNQTLYKYSNTNAQDSIRLRLNEFLKKYSNEKNNDTLFISYRYNDGSCWRMLDKTNDQHINKFVTSFYNRIIDFGNQYPKRTFLVFKEKGTRHNKIVKFNKYIIEDTDNSIFKLLFNDKSICGNSIILFPNNRFILLKDDSHLEVLDFDKKKIIKILNSSKN